MTKVAVVTADYNDHADTRDLLLSAKKLNTQGLEMLWITVDNGSDESLGKIVKEFPGVTWLQTGKNLGYAGGFDRGMRYAREWGADYVLIINDDTLIGDKDLLQKLLDVFAKNPKAGLVSPKIYFAPEFEFYKERYSSKDKGNVVWYAGGKFDWNNVRSVHRGIDEVDTGKYDKIEKTGFISGACILVKKEVLDKVGYFEEKLFAYYEDADWVERVKAAGYEQWYVGNTYIYHKVSRTAGIGSAWSDYLISRNRLWFGLKYAPLRTKFALLRQSLGFLVTGRAAQKEGVIDYFRGVWGWKRAHQPKKVEYPLTLSIVAINYKSTKFTLGLLKSIYDKKSGFYDVKGGAEAIILDNSPEEPCGDEVLAKYPNVKFIENPENNGFAAGNNQMINYSLGRYVLLVNADIEIRPKALTNLLLAINKYGDRALYAGRLLFGDGKLQDSCFKLPTPWHAFEEYFLGRKGSYFMFAPKTNRALKIEGAVMACVLIPTKVINEIGLLQEETFIYFEDIEYARRARDRGIPFYYIPSSRFTHYHGQSSKRAGLVWSNEKLVAAAKWYFGPIKYLLVTAVLWLGQKVGRTETPTSKWKDES